MVSQRMRSHEGFRNGVGGTQTETQISNQGQRSTSLARQGSLYRLTLEEVENQLDDLGKPLGSMNLDELLKTVWTAETNTDHHHPTPSFSGLSSNRNPNILLPEEFGKKTVDEVWQGIQDEQKRSNLERKASLGEMTLEDFLVKAGIVAEASKNAVAVPDPAEFPQWMSYQVPSVPVFMPGHPYGHPECKASFSASSSLMGDIQTPGRERVTPDDVAEMSVDRRQKRMIKNRESAARSRARKQAYTNELEKKVALLEEENERLRRLKELELLLPNIPQPEPRYQLRRTSSSPL